MPAMQYYNVFYISLMFFQFCYVVCSFDSTIQYRSNLVNVFPYDGITVDGLIRFIKVNSFMQCVQHCTSTQNCKAGKYGTKLMNEPRNCKIFVEGQSNTETEASPMEAERSFILFKKRTEEDWKELTAWNSCQEVYYVYPNIEGKVVRLKGIGRHYCKMNISPCGNGGWTLVMKMDGSKDTFKYDADVWKNNDTFNEEECLKNPENNTEEGKFIAYSQMPFKMICLGMKVGNQTKYINVTRPASSLLAVIGSGMLERTYLGRSRWKSLYDDASLQLYCNKEGFNAFVGNVKVRIGLIANQENECISPDSLIGFGIEYSSACVGKRQITCGNAAFCVPDNGLKVIRATGFIYVQ